MKLNTILSSFLVVTLTYAGGVHSAFAEKSSKPSQKVESVAAVSDDDDNVAGSYLSGQFARTSGDIDGAIRYLRSVHEKSPEDVNVTIQLQGMLLLQGDFDEALQLAGDISDSNTKDPLSDLLMVLYQIKNNNPDEAAAILADANEDGSVQLWVPLVSGWVDLSRHQLSKPLTVDGLGVDVGRAVPLVNYHLALINNQGGFKDAAARNFNASIEDPVNPPDRIMKSVLKFYDQNDTPETLTPLVKSYMESHPNADNGGAPVIATPQDGIAEVLYTMGGIMYGAGVVNDAAIYLQLATYIKPDMDEATIALGDAYGELKQYARSTAAYARILPTSPLYAKAQLHIAINYERMGKLSEALKRLDDVAGLVPDAPEMLVTKGDLLRIHGRFSEAVVAYGQALERMPAGSDESWAILFARASCLDRLGKWPAAEKDLQQALLLKPDQPDVLNYLGFGWLEHGVAVDQAREMIEKAVKARPNDAQIVDSMGWALYVQGNYPEATQYLERAIELLPGDSTVNDHLGDVYWRLGRKNEARFQWERALTFSPETKEVNSIHKKLKEGLPPGALASSTSVVMAGKPPTTVTP